VIDDDGTYLTIIRIKISRESNFQPHLVQKVRSCASVAAFKGLTLFDLDPDPPAGIGYASLATSLAVWPSACR
jgi:hypothetical protein